MPDSGEAAWAGLAGARRVRERLHAWVGTRADIQAAAAFGSMERTDRPADDWADLDLLFVVDELDPWFEDLAWVDDIAPVWIRLVHDAPVPGVRVVQVLFEGGYDADLIPIDREQLAFLKEPGVAADVFGYGGAVVLDRIGAFDGVLPFTGETAGIQPPTPDTFDHVVSTFLYQTVWATKRLRRGELWRAHDDVDDYLRDRLLWMLEWHALARGVAGVFPESRKLEDWVPADVAAELPETFAAYSAAGIADALVRGHALFRRAAREVAERFGLDYPEAADAHVERWVRARLAEAGLGSA